MKKIKEAIIITDFSEKTIGKLKKIDIDHDDKLFVILINSKMCHNNIWKDCNLYNNSILAHLEIPFVIIDGSLEDAFKFLVKRGVRMCTILSSSLKEKISIKLAKRRLGYKYFVIDFIS